MSFQTDPNKIKEELVRDEEAFNKRVQTVNSPEVIQKRVVHGLALDARGIGCKYIALGNFSKAKEYFFKAFEFEEDWVNLVKNDPMHSPDNSLSNFYSMVLEYLETAIMTLDRKVMREAASKFDLNTNVKDWYASTRPYYCLIKVYKSLMLEVDTNEIRQLKEQSLDMKREPGIDASLNVLWAILDNNLKELQESFQDVVASESHGGGFDQQPISVRAMVLLILAKLHGIDLGNFDPALTDTRYITF